MGLDRVNKFLANNEPLKENEVVIDGPNVLKNIVVSEILDISRLSSLSSELLNYLSKDIKKLSRKEQQSFWKDVEEVNARKEAWVAKVMQDAAKNGIVNKLLNIASSSNETVISENGEVFTSSVTPEDKKRLSALIVDLLNDQNRS